MSLTTNPIWEMFASGSGERACVCTRTCSTAMPVATRMTASSARVSIFVMANPRESEVGADRALAGLLCVSGLRVRRYRLQKREQLIDLRWLQSPLERRHRRGPFQDLVADRAVSTLRHEIRVQPRSVC